MKIFQGKQWRKMAGLLFLVTTVCFVSSGVRPLQLAGQNVKYRVFCVNGRIEIQSRTLEEMKKARGSNVCQLGSEHDSTTAAYNYARLYGGVGASCSCPK